MERDIVLELGKVRDAKTHIEEMTDDTLREICNCYTDQNDELDMYGFICKVMSVVLVFTDAMRDLDRMEQKIRSIINGEDGADYE